MTDGEAEAGCVCSWQLQTGKLRQAITDRETKAGYNRWGNRGWLCLLTAVTDREAKAGWVHSALIQDGFFSPSVAGSLVTALWLCPGRESGGMALSLGALSSQAASCA